MKKINEEDLKMVTGGNTQGKEADSWCKQLVDQMLNKGSIKESERERGYDKCMEECAWEPVIEPPVHIEENFDLPG